MRPTINIDNYEEIMFQLLEGDFDEQTCNDLLQQIEKDELFKFEWEAWQKTRFVDPIENYTASSKELTEKIMLIAGSQTAGRKRFFYYWAAAASILLLIASLFILMTDFTSRPKQEVVVSAKESKITVKDAIPPTQNQTAAIAISSQKKSRNLKKEKQLAHFPADSTPLIPHDNTLAEIPNVIDSVPIKANELAMVPEKKPRYTITVETSDISVNNQNSNDLAQNKKGNIKKVFTNTKLILSRKPNGEPDKIILVGDENSYLCININY